MANDFVNTITTKDGTTYDIQDKRLTVTVADAGKVVAVDSNGNLSLTDPNRRTKLYEHFYLLQDKSSMQHWAALYIITKESTLCSDINGVINLVTDNDSIIARAGYAGHGYSPVLGIAGGIMRFYSWSSSLIEFDVNNCYIETKSVTEL